MTLASRFCPLVNVVRDVVSRVKGRGASSSSRMEPGANSPRLGASGGGGGRRRRNSGEDGSRIAGVKGFWVFELRPKMRSKKEEWRVWRWVRERAHVHAGWGR